MSKVKSLEQEAYDEVTEIVELMGDYTISELKSAPIDQNHELYEWFQSFEDEVKSCKTQSDWRKVARKMVEKVVEKGGY